METTVIMALLAVSIVLFVLSFIKKDKQPEMDRKMENFSVSLMREMDRVNKKVTVLEEEVFQAEKGEAARQHSKQEKEILIMYNEGHDAAAIAKACGVPENDVKAVISNEQHKSEVV